MKNNKSKYYYIHNKNLAIAISYLINEDFFIFDDRYDRNRKVYSFVDSEKFNIAFDLLTNTRKQFLNK